MHRKKQRAFLAASFVVTTTALVACAGTSTPDPQFTHNPPMPTNSATVPQLPNSNPPMGGPTVAPTSTTAPLPQAPDGNVEKMADGRCWWEPPPMKCKPGVKCNPPSGFEVECPK
jgi:hypothetical protein